MHAALRIRFHRCIAAALPLLAAGAWFLLRHHAPGAPIATRSPGWIAILLPSVAALLILREASIPAVPSPHASLRILRFIPSEASTSLAILIIVGATVGWAPGLRAALLFIAWLCLVSGLTRAFRRIGAAPAIAFPLLISNAMLAAPILFTPALHATADTPLQHALARWLVYTCPALGEINALLPNLHTDWSVLPGMYAHSGLGQEVPVSLPLWWITTLLLAATAAALHVTSFSSKEAQPTPP